VKLTTGTVSDVRCGYIVGRELADGIGAAVLSASDKPALPAAALAAGRAAPDTTDATWDAFVGKMACKGELLALDHQEQIVVKQQMLDRLMLLERELQERTVVIRSASLSLSPYSVYCSLCIFTKMFNYYDMLLNSIMRLKT